MHSLPVRIRTWLHGKLMGLIRAYYVNVWGMKLGREVRIALTAKLDQSYPQGIIIGDYSAVAFGATILSHDISTMKRAETRIGTHCLIGGRAIILPGITIGDHCVIGAGAVVMTNVPSNSMVLGNPARIIERGINTLNYGIRKEIFESIMEQERRSRDEAAARMANPSAQPHIDVA